MQHINQPPPYFPHQQEEQLNRPSLIDRVKTTIGKTFSRAISYKLTTESFNMIHKAILFASIPYKCLYDVVSSNQTLSQAKDLTEAILKECGAAEIPMRLCNKTTILDIFTYSRAPAAEQAYKLYEILNLQGFRTAVCCDGICRGILGCFSGDNKLVNLAITATSIVMLLQSLPQNFSSYPLETPELFNGAHNAWNLCAFVVYHGASSLISTVANKILGG